MKKYIRRIAALLVSVTALFAAASCGAPRDGGRGWGNWGTGTLSKLDNTYVDLSGAASIGIVNKKIGGDSEKKRNYLVTFDKDNNIEEVVFYKDKTNESGGITQESIKGEIDKCYVAGQLTFLRFAVGGVDGSDYIPSDYYIKDYICDDSYQSFVVDNQTGKVYSLETIGSLSKVSTYSVVIDRIYYYLSVSGQGLQITRVVNNPNVSVENVFKDKYGHTFIQTDKLAEVDGKTVYYTYEQHLFGDDGRMYLLEESFWDYSIHYYDENLQLRDVENNLTTRLWYKEDYNNFLLKNNCLYELAYGLAIRYCPRRENSLFEYADSVDTKNPVILGTTIFGLSDGLCVYEYKDGQMTKTHIMDLNTYYEKEDYLIATVESASDTKQYKIWVENGTVKKELIEQTVYDEEIFVVQPLN